MIAADGLTCGGRFSQLWSGVTRAALIALCMAFAACASNPTHNVPLRPGSGDTYDFRNWIANRDQLDESLIALSFSGGGVRAAALAASVVEKLDSLDLYDRVAIISSTSGGSVTAGFVAANGVEEFINLDRNFLLKDNTADLAPGVMSSFLTGSNRSQKFADYLDQRLFEGGTTYDDLRTRWPEAPFVILNASDASTGYNFEFTQNGFSTLCSDLGRFRISEAIAASAAFPFLMSPITLRNNWDQPVCRSDVKPPPFDELGYAKASEQRYVDLEKFVRWRHTHSLRYTYESDPESKRDPERITYRPVRFVHLLDGGLSDNLAARALLRSFGENIDTLKKKKVRRILLIQVNAKSDSPRVIDQSGKIPSTLDVLNSAVMNPIDVTTALSSYISRQYMVEVVKYMNNREATTEDAKLYFYPVQVDFDHLVTGSDNQMRAKGIKTWWTLPPADIDFLKSIGKELLERHPCFQAFARDSGIKGTHVNSADKCTEFISIQVADAGRLIPPPPAPAMEPIPAPEPPSISAEVITLNLLFDFGSAMIKDDMIPVLEKAKQILNDFPDESLAILGHTCSIGTAAYNQTLSERRADAVKKWLVSNRIDPNRLDIVGYGEDRPKFDNGTDEGRKLNRRVEIKIIIH